MINISWNNSVYFIALFTFHIVCSLLKYDDIGGKLIQKQNVKVAIFQKSLFKCSECNYTTKYKQNLQRHKKIHGLKNFTK